MIIQYPGITITDDLKDICNQFKSGELAKKAGEFDEYYTDHKIVLAISNLIKDQFKNKKNYLFWNRVLGLETLLCYWKFSGKIGNNRI